MTIPEEFAHHAAAVNAAAVAVDAARAAGDHTAELQAIRQLEAADAARKAFLTKYERAGRGPLDDHDPARAPGRRFFDGDPR